MRLRFKDALDSYLSELEARGQAERTLYQNRMFLSQFIDFCRNQGLKEVQAITDEHVASYHRYMTWRPSSTGGLLSPNSLSHILRLVRSFLRWLHDRGDIFRDVTRGWVLPRVQSTNTRTPTIEEMSKLLLTPNVKDSLGLRDRAIIELLYGTGVRVGECRSLKLKNLDLQASQLQVVEGKGSKSRNLPLGSRLKQILRRYLEDRKQFAPDREQTLFVNAKGKPMSTALVSRILYKHAKEAGIKPFGAHAIRRGFATHLLEKGADVKVIQLMLGHEHLSSTHLYLQPDFQELKKVYNRTHPRAKRQS